METKIGLVENCNIRVLLHRVSDSPKGWLIVDLIWFFMLDEVVVLFETINTHVYDLIDGPSSNISKYDFLYRMIQSCRFYIGSLSDRSL